MPQGMKQDLTPAICRAARALLDWTQDRLAQEAGVGITTLRTFEKGNSKPVAQNLAALQRTLEAAGVDFIPENGSGGGVQLRKPAGVK